MAFQTMRALFLVSLLLFGVDAVAGSNTPIHAEGKLASGMEYQLDIEEDTFSPPRDVTSEDGSIWGVDGDFPKTSVKNFSLLLNGKAAYIPRKFYTDLSAIRKATVTGKRDGTVKVLIEGGDAAGGYFGEFVFRKNRLVERTMHVREFSNEVWEKVVLHNDLMDHPEKY